jgi:nucleotide-binding universal stress UspA family protein
MATQVEPTATGSGITHVFERVLVGVDRSEASIEAARQAAVLTEHYGSLTLLGIYPPPARTGLDAVDDPSSAADREAIEQAVEKAEATIGRLVAPTTKVARGYVWEGLIEEATDTDDTLVVVASEGPGRIEGIIGGSTETELIHKSPCSVLVARPATDRFPERIVVGLDGSPESARAYAAARRLAARFGSVLWPVVARGGKQVDVDEVARLTHDRYEELPGEPLGALAAASADADLLVVGSRGLHGLKALGSVSERIAHRAHCSTLVVRDGKT